MNLVIHDMDPVSWADIADEYSGWTVISDNGHIRPCVGCFGCWNRTPGQCVIKDGYDRMGCLIHHADETVIISRYTYGGFSGFIKNVCDRCLGYVLPQFELVNGESHHQKRYQETKPFTFIFYGHELSDEEKDSAERYVKAVCTNFRSQVREVIFRETLAQPQPDTDPAMTGDDRIILLNASMRSAKGNSALLARQLQKQLKKESEIINLSQFIGDYGTLMTVLTDVSTLILCQPLYVDGLPSQLIHLLEYMQKNYHGPVKKVYVLANMGLYESRQLINQLDAVRQWCRIMDFEYCGALAVGAGELVGAFIEMNRFGKWPLQQIASGMAQLAEAVNKEKTVEDIYVGPVDFPRPLYMAIANSGWPRMARQNGITKKDLYRQL